MGSTQSNANLPELKELQIKDIICKKEFMIRDGIDKKLVAQYKDDYDVIIQQAPISVYDTPLGFYLSDGFHRIEAGKQLGKETISSIVTKGSVKEAYAAACLANLKHGKPLTKNERIRARKTFIKIYPEWSNVKLADDVGCNEKTIRDYRTELEKSKDILPQTSRIGKDGKTRPLPTKSDTATSEKTEVEQKPKKKTKHDTSDKEKLDSLYKKIKKSAFTGQKPTSQSSIEKAENLGLNVTEHKEKLEEIKQVLTDSIGKQYSEVKDDLKVAHKKSTAIKKTLKAQIKAEEARIKKSEEDLKESLRDEITEEVTQQVIERTENERLEKSSETNVHVTNATGENEWYTPKIYIDAAKKVMGTIDVDPASTEIANKIVNAEKYYSIKDDGRLQKWDGNVWMNPPYSQPLVTEFCNLLVEKIKKGEIKQACVLVNNATETLFYQNMLSCCQAVCFIKGRVKFIDKKGKSTGVPLQGQTILYFGEYEKPFGEIFSEFGRVLYATS